MINYNTLAQNSKIHQLIQESDTFFEQNDYDQVQITIKQIVDYLAKEHQLSNSILYEAFIYSAIMMFQCKQFKLFYQYAFTAQQYSHHNNDIHNFLYSAFVELNRPTMQDNYIKNIQALSESDLLHFSQLPSFSELAYWITPTDEDDFYYLYNHSSHFIDSRIFFFERTVDFSFNGKDSFSDFVFEIEWNPGDVVAISNDAVANNKLAYIIVKQPGKFLASLQGRLLPNLKNIVLFDSTEKFKAYFQNHNAYLPRNIDNKTSSEITTIIQELHETRVHNPNRPERVLLTVGIPSYNRGHRALENIKHLMKLPYDYEIEFLVSNNGTANETTLNYAEIGDLNDSRVTYFRFNENKGFSLNFTKLCELARGQYILFLSDEDLADLNSLAIILSFLKNQQQPISIMKTSTSNQYHWKDLRTKGGLESVKNFMFTSNYMSGHIFNLDLIKKHNGIDYLKNNQNNSVVYWYPHMYLELLLLQYGDVVATSVLLVIEGKAEKTEFTQSNIDDSLSIPQYATIESRLEQHRDFLVIMSQLDINKNDLEWYRKMYLYLCQKTLFLTKLSLDKYYSATTQDLSGLKEKIVQACIDVTQYQRYISTEQEIYEFDQQIIHVLYNNVFVE